jgi:hypothetical protein
MYLRVADPHWQDPLSGEHARRRGGRWNPPGAFRVVYLNASLNIARALVRSRLRARGIHPEDVLPETGPILVHTIVPEGDYGDAVTEPGLRAVGLPASYPRDGRGRTIPHRVCQPIGQRAFAASERGIACRSATPGAPAQTEELAYFDRRKLDVAKTQIFTDWIS